MNCTYCGTRNSEDDHRCSRCGRRLHLANARRAPSTYPVARSSAAPAIVPNPPAAPVAAPPKSVEAKPKVPHQPSLFPPPELPRLIPFESISPATARAPGRAARSARPETKPRSGSSGRRVSEAQQRIDFPSAIPVAEVERYCDSPVALPLHRIMAAALDLSMVLIGFGFFLLLLHLAGGDIVLNSRTVPFYISAAVAMALFYKLLWCLANSDTPGMLWSRLRVLNFDGHRPTRQQRLQRFAGACLGLLAAGLGLLWALVDEENLAWHDHVSKTFPTPHLS